MKPFYWRGTTNFGDYLNSWLWPELIPELIEIDDNIRLVGIGSLLKSSLNYLEGTKVIFGTGSGYGNIPAKKAYEDWQFRFVRGPLTAKCFELDESKAVVDGAWLVGLLPQFPPATSKKGVAFVPHWTTAETGNWLKVCEDVGFTYVDPLGDLHNILSQINASELVVTESLHGAIMADLFRTPWIPVSMSPKFLPFKWVDWFKSIEVNADVYQLPLSDRFEYLVSNSKVDRIDYQLKMNSLKYDITFEDEAAAPDSHKVDFKYRSMIRAKKIARNLRGSAFSKVQAYRDIWPVRTWNEKHREQLSKMLLELSAKKPFLSTDTLRESKLNQLSGLVEQLKRDYGKLG